MKRTILALMVSALFLGAGTWFVSAQQAGGAFNPDYAYSYISGFPRLLACGTSTTCANTASGKTAQIVTGLTTLTAGSATVSGISPAFTSTSTFRCVGTDTSGASGVSAEVVPASASSISIGGTTTGTVAWLCAGY